jgi:hypothetical protein
VTALLNLGASSATHAGSTKYLPSSHGERDAALTGTGSQPR